MCFSTWSIIAGWLCEYKKINLNLEASALHNDTVPVLSCPSSFSFRSRRSGFPACCGIVHGCEAAAEELVRAAAGRVEHRDSRRKCECVQLTVLRVCKWSSRPGLAGPGLLVSSLSWMHRWSLPPQFPADEFTFCVAMTRGLQNPLTPLCRQSCGARTRTHLAPANCA